MGLRQERLADRIRDLIAETLSGGQLGDPRLQLIAITSVKLTGDLQDATVYFRILDDKLEKDVVAGLKSATGFFRNILARQLDVRRAPQIRFKFDKSLENAAKIEKLIQKIYAE